MARLSDSLNLSNGIKHIPISDLIARAKTLIGTRGYSQSTARHYNERFNDLRKNAALFGVETLSEEFIKQFINEGAFRSSKRTNSSVQRKSILNLIATSAGDGHIFNFEHEADIIQTQSLVKSLEAYDAHLKEQEKRKETIKSYLQTATKFLIYLEEVKKTAFSEVSAIDIQGFIVGLSAKWSLRSMRLVPSQLKNYLKFMGVSADVVLFSSFSFPRKSTPIRAMSDENVEALWMFVKSDAGDLRSKAIVAMLLSTGMRPVDITGLTLDDIDWRNDAVGFMQSKTGECMNFELFPAMGSAIARYILEERPKGTGEKHVFLTVKAPHRRMSPSNCNRILKSALENAGATFFADRLHSPRAVRRSLVSRMVAKGIPVQKAAASIGHVDEKSVDLYIELDVEKMRSVCLPIPTQMKGWCWING
jgi:site-specific recombinase XerD